MSENANINDNLSEIKAEMVKDNKRDAVKDNIFRHSYRTAPCPS